MLLIFNRRRARVRLACTVALCVVALPAVPALAQEAKGPFDISASVRVRGEAMDGQFRPTGPANDALISVQTDIEASYKAGPVTFAGELIDGRTYGQKSNSTTGTTENDALEPVQAYVALDLADIAGMPGKSTLMAGRFTLQMGSGRVIGRPAYPNSPTSYLGGKFDWSNKRGDAFTAFWALPSDRLPVGEEARDHGVELDRATSDRQLFGASFTRGKVLNGTAEFYAYRLFERDAPGHQTRNRQLVTFGARLFRKPKDGQLDHDLEAILQRGTIRATSAASDLTDLDVNAAFVHGEVGTTFKVGWKPRVAAVFDYGTGDHREAGSFGRFDQLYGSRRGDFGPTSLYGPISRSNLVSLGLTLEGKPAKRTDFFVKARELWLEAAQDSFGATGVRDASGQSGRHAGVQVEGRVRQWLVDKVVRLELGGAYLAKGRFLNDAPNAPATGDTRYGYLALSAEW